MTKVVNDLLTAVDSGNPSIIWSQYSTCWNILVCSREPLKSSDSMTKPCLCANKIIIINLARVIHQWPLQLHLSRKLPFYHCWLFYRNAARLRSWTSSLLHIFTTPVFKISYHQFADDTQLIHFGWFFVVGRHHWTIIMWRGSNQVASRELSVAQSVKNWGTAWSQALVNKSPNSIMLLQIHPRLHLLSEQCPSLDFYSCPWLDRHLTVDNHVTKLVGLQSCNFHIRGLCHIRQHWLTKIWPIHCWVRLWVADLTIVTPCYMARRKKHQ